MSDIPNHDGHLCPPDDVVFKSCGEYLESLEKKELLEIFSDLHSKKELIELLSGFEDDIDWKG